MADKPVFDFVDSPSKVGIPTTPPGSPFLGYYVCTIPLKPPHVELIDNKQAVINFTGRPGEASSLYYALISQLVTWGWKVVKVDEWIEVSPTYKEYYERTAQTKASLEGVIKQGLGNAALAVSDFELMSHDLRKYREILGYFASKDNHSLKAMFIDQVDAHTGDSAMRSIAARWPTLIFNFQKVGDDDIEVEKIAEKLHVSKAEASILSTKNRLFVEWKRLFKDAAKQRYELLRGLVEGRKKSINEYKEWLKPYISRFKMTKLGAERPGVRAGALHSFADITGMSTFSNSVRIWAWRPVRIFEHRKSMREFYNGFRIYPYDEHIRNNLILGKRGLASIYPWLRDMRKYCIHCKKYFEQAGLKCPNCSNFLEERTTADEIVDTEILPGWQIREMNLDPGELYYAFMDVQAERFGSRLPNGEIEDITFFLKSALVSQNVLLVKILELKCRERELEHYIDEMLGVKSGGKSIEQIIAEELPGLSEKKEEKLSFSEQLRMSFEKSGKAYNKNLKSLKPQMPKGLMLAKSGNYERDFFDRITKQLIVPVGISHAGIVNFLKEKTGAF